MDFKYLSGFMAKVGCVSDFQWGPKISQNGKIRVLWEIMVFGDFNERHQKNKSFRKILC